MRLSTPTWWPSSHQTLAQQAPPSRLLRPWSPWRAEEDRADPVGAASTQRSSAEMTTLPGTGRGHALRDAHRALAEQIVLHPAIRQALPHLSFLERALAHQGSRALGQLPLSLLKRSLAQLVLLQHDDEAPEDAARLRVLRLRLIEAIAVRGVRSDEAVPRDSASGGAARNAQAGGAPR